MNDLLRTIRNYLPVFKMPQIAQKLVDPNTTERKRVSYQIQTHRRLRFDVEQDDLKTALMHATDEVDPRREMLLEIFREARRDFHLLSQCQNAVDDCLQQGWGWFNDETGELNEEATKLFQKQWFEKLMSTKLWSEFEGYKLAEAGVMIKTDQGWEFKNFKEFPMENVLPERGLLIAHPQASNGVPYRPEDWPDSKEKRQLAEAFGEWLIECGEPENLGLFSIAAKYSIYKKWGMGDWARSSEKWIDPAIVIRSGTDDQTENDKKADMAKNWGNNNWMLLDDQDEVELLERRNASGFTITKEMLAYLDAENAKGINGQTATSDEKAWTGSSEVQERTQIKRTRRRLRNLMYWINETVKPWLLAVNNGDTAYQAIAGHSWKPLSLTDEDDGESTDPEQSDDPKNSPNNSSKRAGGTAVGKRLTALPQDQSAGLSSHTRITDSYSDEHICEHATHDHFELHNSADLQKLAQRMAEQIHARKIREGQIDPDLVAQQAKELEQALSKGYEDALDQPKFGSQAHRRKVQLKYNVHVMAAFKNHHNVLDIHDLLLDDEGNIKPKGKFLKDIKSVNADYNKNWAATEYRLATANARAASKYMTYVEKGGSIVYQAIRDGRTRPEHEELHGTTYPVGHEFWDRWFPPNGWGCRCYTRWISEEKTVAPKSLPDQKTMFAQNPGRSGKIFNEDHPYFDIAQKWAERAQRLFGYTPPIDLDKFMRNMSVYDELEASAEHKLIHSNVGSGGFLFRHNSYDKSDYRKNEPSVKLMADHGYAVEWRQHVDTPGINNPELSILNEITDIKNAKGRWGINSAMTEAKNKQGLTSVAISIDDSWKRKELIDRLSEGFRYRKKIEKVWIIYKKDVYEITREQWAADQLEAIIK